MLRLFTPGETGLWLEQCRDYVMAEFGDDSCSSMENWREKYAAGQFIHQPYGDFADDPPTLLGIMTCIPLSHREYDALKQHRQKDNELTPWTPADGKAVLWVDVVISEAPGNATKCIAGMLDLLNHHPCKPHIDMVAMVCTGPQGYLMAQTFGLQEIGISYKEGQPFMQRAITPGELDRAGEVLFETWSITKAKKAIGTGLRKWGLGWKSHRLE